MTINDVVGESLFYRSQGEFWLALREGYEVKFNLCFGFANNIINGAETYAKGFRGQVRIRVKNPYLFNRALKESKPAP